MPPEQPYKLPEHTFDRVQRAQAQPTNTGKGRRGSNASSKGSAADSRGALDQAIAAVGGEEAAASALMGLARRG